MQFSVLMSIYKNESVDNFCLAIESLLNQTVRPDEIILVRDGQIFLELQQAIDRFVSMYSFIKCIPLEKNGGLGNALRIGLNHTQFEIVARMDTDDVCVVDRFEKQLRFLEKNPDVAVVGGQVKEFVDVIDNVVAIKCVPTTDEEIKHYMRFRCPFNHPSVMFRKEAVKSVGGYEELHFLEDYYLWCRMYANGCKFANLEDVLVYMRTNESTYLRRGGIAYYHNYKRLEKYKRKQKLTGFWQYRKNLFVRFIQAIAPNRMRKLAYRKLRSNEER